MYPAIQICVPVRDIACQFREKFFLLFIRTPNPIAAWGMAEADIFNNVNYEFYPQRTRLHSIFKEEATGNND